jgi:hypothetical protein
MTVEINHKFTHLIKWLYSSTLFNSKQDHTLGRHTQQWSITIDKEKSHLKFIGEKTNSFNTFF